QDALVASWRKKDRGEIEGAAQVVALYRQIEKLDQAARDRARDENQAGFLATWRENKADPASQWAVATYEQAHKPIAEGPPPLTRQMTDANLELLCFVLGEVRGKPFSAPGRAVRDYWAKHVAEGYQNRDAAQRKLLADTPTGWAAVREGWPKLSEEQKAACRGQWKQQFGATIAAAEALERNGLANLAGLQLLREDMVKEIEAAGEKITGADAETQRAALLKNAQGQAELLPIVAALAGAPQQPGTTTAAAPAPAPAGPPADALVPDEHGAFPAIDAPGRAAPDDEDRPRPERRPGYILGTITDARGKPIKAKDVKLSAAAGGTTMAGRTAGYNLAVAEDGTFCQQVPDGVYNVTARVKVKFNGVTVYYDAHPVDGVAVVSLSSAPGIIREFRWRLTGLRPGYEGTDGREYYGAFLRLAEPKVDTGFPGHVLGKKYPGGTVELVLTPRGPLVDGSPGRVYRCPCKAEGINWYSIPPIEYRNIAQGSYTATATITDARGGKGRLKLSTDWQGKFAESLEVNFPVLDEHFRPIEIYLID
ncbi:MAG TPA: carboxypeptidase-like regulatory domain-containing protein, partial [Phycisphaerae bacterium]|nr:carboxypeptidase-like regulatory domain-containing protein [Phycisphaerae bacterium]